MTEAEWLRSVDARPMIRFASDKGSDRLWRLYSVACMRRFLEDLPHPASQRALDVAERFADGLATAEELATAHALGEIAAEEASREEWENEARIHFHWNDEQATLYARSLAAESVLQCVVPEANAELATRYLCADLLREIFGNPFQWKEVNSIWLTWNDGVVPNLAQTIYDKQAFDRLPILADALEDTGCADADMLEHLRSPGPHVRGCWVLDLILGKE